LLLHRARRYRTGSRADVRAEKDDDLDAKGARRL
jgi:hypothetical protein